MKRRPRKVAGTLWSLRNKELSKSIARKLSSFIKVDLQEVIDLNEGRERRAKLEAAVEKLTPAQVLDLIVEVDLLLQRADNTAIGYIETAKATNEQLKLALSEKQLVLEDLSKLVNNGGDAREAESMEQLVPAVKSLFKELELQNKELFAARVVAEDAAKSKMNFLANMSHEIRTPMNGIFGMVNLMLSTPLNNEQKDYIETIENSTKSLLTILNDVLEYSKLSQSDLVLEERVFAPRRLVTDVVRTFEHTATKKGISLKGQVDEGVLDRLVGDDHRIRQILSNLVGNAVKFTKRGEVCLRISVISLEGDCCKLRFSVSDTGIGMDEETVKRLFQPFMQADASITRNYGGTGLGLAICKELAEAMQGSLSIESQSGTGSVFHFELGLSVEEESKGAGFAEVREGSRPAWFEPEEEEKPSKGEVLLVEDIEANQRVASIIIGKMGYTVTIASNGLEAVELTKEKRFGVILMDLSMPVMDGFEASRQIRQQSGQAEQPEQPTIIALTGHAFGEHRQRCEEVGMDDFLTKPFDIFKLKDKLDHYFSEAVEVS